MISVALCTYNGERYIKDQLESIVYQTVPVDEIVICDDCSTDSTIQIVKTIAAQHQYIEFKITINDTNIGVRRNFENALKLCNGDVMLLSDQDDIWFPEKVETIVNYFEKNPQKDTIISNAILVDGDDKIISDMSLLDCVGLNHIFLSKATNDNLIDLFISSNRATGATMAIKNTVPVRFNYHTLILHDYILAIEALSRNSLGIIEQPLTKYRIHQGQERGIGNAIEKPWESNIYELRCDRMGNYPLPTIFAQKTEMRHKRYDWMAGLSGIVKILFNWNLYRKIYPNSWKSYMSVDMNHTVGLYKQRHKKSV